MMINISKNKDHNCRRDGFTLIELLVAMGIIAVLTGLAIFNFNQSRIRARDIQRKNDLKQLQTALELYKNDTNSYPAAADFQTTLQIPVAYTKVTFADPRASEWVDYRYLPAVDLKTYYLQTCLENAADTTKTTNTATCDLFDSQNHCNCGSTITKNGSMYIISQP